MPNVPAKKVAAKVAEPVAIATPAEEIVDVVAPAVEAPEYEFDVAEPFIMKPQDLPLVVKPGAGKEWVNAEQAEYAKTLNGYAYKNPVKWQTKKAKMLKNLTRLATEPSYINFLRGVEPDSVKLTYSNKLMQL